MKHVIRLFLFLGSITGSYAQSTMLWSRDHTMGLGNSFSDCPTVVASHDTIETTGISHTPDGQRLLRVRYNLQGDLISTSTYGNDSVSKNTIIDYTFDQAGYVYLLQKQPLDVYKSKIVIQKYALNGSLIWVQQIHDLTDTSYVPHSLGISTDHTLFISAYKEYDFLFTGGDVISKKQLSCLYAYDKNGSMLWQRSFNPSSEINAFSPDFFIYQDTAFLFGFNYGFTGITLLKVDSKNNLLLNVNTGLQNGVNTIQLTPDNNLLITSGAYYRVTKIDLTGNIHWTKHYETYLPSNVSGDEIQATIQDTDGNIYVSGRHYGKDYGTPSYTNADILTLKYDKNGNLLWENRYVYGVNNADIANTIALKNNNIYVGGESQRMGSGTDYDYLVLKMDVSTGVKNGIYNYTGTGNGNDVVTSLYVFNNGNVALTGLSSFNSKYDRTTQLLSDVILSVQSTSADRAFKVYPNPVTRNHPITISSLNPSEYEIVSMIGQTVQAGKLTNTNSQSIQLNDLPAGLYMLKVKQGQEVLTTKLVVN